jgi:hypothetical protein
VISDESLRDFIVDCSLLLGNVVQRKLSLILQYVRKSTKEEQRWLRMIHGSNKADQILASYYDVRHSLSRKKKAILRERAEREIKVLENEMREAIRYLNETYANTIDRYHFPSEKIIQLIYPNFLQVH